MTLHLSPDALTALIPLHLSVTADGAIGHLSPTLGRIAGGRAGPGQPLLQVFDFSRPRAPRALSCLLAQAGRRLACRLRGDAETAFDAVIVPAGQGGALLSLSFGVSVAQAVARHGLGPADFPPTDPTLNLLYLIEAQQLTRMEWNRLSHRLEGARSVAEAQAMADPLTGLANRRALTDAMARLTAGGLPFGLIHMDLDRFKQVNDRLGHAAGDAVLLAVADILRAELRAEDLPARLGGDEFVILLPGQILPARLTAIAARLIARIQDPMPVPGGTARISASAGIALGQGPGQDALSVLARADDALYASKRAGRARATLHPDHAG